MNLRLKDTIASASLAVFLVMAGPVEAFGSEQFDNPPAPDFTLPDIMNGDKVTLSALKGKWVFLNFWATWCTPCVIEMPMMEKLYKEMRKEGMEMLAISVDEGSPAMVKEFIDRYKFTFTILHDPENSVMREYGVRSIPKTYFVDPDGNVQAKAEGVREWDNPEMLKFFRQVMAEYEKKKAAKTGKAGKPPAKEKGI